MKGGWLRCLVLIGTTSLLLTAQPASATTLKLTGAGTDPAIAVDDNGTGHIAWTESDSSGNGRVTYCRLPRGTTACANLKRFSLGPNYVLGGPWILIGNGQVILAATRCCTADVPTSTVWVARSSDGGATFSAPRKVGENDVGDVGFGPGDFSISTVGAPAAGVIYQAAPLDGPAVPFTQRAKLKSGLAPASTSSIGFVDALTPMVAWTDHEDRSFFRVYDRTGSYNSASNWTPESPPIPGNEAELASGLRGAFLSTQTGAPAERRYVVRRFNEFAGTFGDAMNMTPAGEPIFRDFSEDAGGHLHAIWIDNAAAHEPLLYRRSIDGQHWGKPRALATVNDSGFNLRVGAAADGGGWAVWNTKSGGAAVKAAPFKPIGGGGGGCVPSVKYGKAVALATEGCFRKDGEHYTTSGSARLNGIDLYPNKGTKITIDKGAGTLKSSDRVLVKTGNVELDRQQLGWRLPKQGGQLEDLAGNPAVFNAGSSNVEFFRLPVSGWVSPILTDPGAAKMPVNLTLPKPFSSLLGGRVTGSTTLRLDNQHGLILSGAELKVGSVFLGIAEVKDLVLEYTGGGSFVLRGRGTIVLPVAKSTLETRFGLADGSFDYGRAKLTFDDPGRPVSQFTYLRSIDFAVATDPTRIGGGVTATGGPTLTLGGTPYAAVTVDGHVTYAFTNPGVFTAEGVGQLFNVNAADVRMRFVTSGKLSLAGSFSIPAAAVRLSGSVSGDVSLGNGAFNLLGKGQGCGMDPIPGCVQGIKVLVSSKAAAGCAEGIPIVVSPGPPPEVKKLSGGIAYDWHSGFATPFAGCDLSPYEVSVSKLDVRRAFARGAGVGVRIGGSMKQVNLAIKGTTRPPRVRITGPDGATVVAPPDPNGTATGTAGIITRSAEDETTYAALLEPSAGTWTIASLPGSPTIVRVLTADGLPRPRVHARVRKRAGRKRVLTYRVRKIDGQVVRFFEHGQFGTRLIGRARGKHGRISFSPADGPGGKRTVTADVESFGVPRAALDVATYEAPGPIKPAKPRHLRIRRRHGIAHISWRPARHAVRYAVQAKLRDGRRLNAITRKTRMRIQGVERIDRARVRVAGLKADNTHGKPAHARLKARPKKRHHSGRRREPARARHLSVRSSLAVASVASFSVSRRWASKRACRRSGSQCATAVLVAGASTSTFALP